MLGRYLLVLVLDTIYDLRNAFFFFSGTFKMRKVDLQKEGYNPAVVTDKLYYLDQKLDKYVPLGNEEYEKIVSGAIRL